ncbi:MAG: SMC-Scp complex subunit ScpB [Tissierellia bacterium]|nr:SMC-Scp complex subunit ScpB [Tissierellia bacterium]
MENLRRLELLLFVSREPLSTPRAASLLGINASDIQRLIEELRSEYHEQKKAITIQSFGNFHQLSTNDLYQDLVDAFIGSSPYRGLGPSTLEVLSIIAYRQPITRAQIDELRGVSSDYSIRVLLERDLIRVSGVLDALGNPKLYITTPRFLRNFNLENLDELPSIGD